MRPRTLIAIGAGLILCALVSWHLFQCRGEVVWFWGILGTMTVAAVIFEDWNQ